MERKHVLVALGCSWSILTYQLLNYSCKCRSQVDSRKLESRTPENKLHTTPSLFYSEHETIASITISSCTLLGVATMLLRMIIVVIAA